MRLRHLACAALGATLLLPAFPAGAADSEVKVANFFYRSAYVRVDPGDTVTWRIRDGSNHTMTTRPGAPESFDSGEKEPGSTYEFTFTQPGRYLYTCKIHPRLGQRGVVQVGPDTIRPVVDAQKAKRGARSVRIYFRLSEDAKVKAAFRRGSRAVKTVNTALLIDGKRSLVFKRAKPLAPGSYTVRLTATDYEGNASRPAKVTFSVPKPRAARPG